MRHLGIIVMYINFYTAQIKDTMDDIKDITDFELLHIIAGNYNCGNGFEIPYNIINNSNCDLGTALIIFFDDDGHRILENREELKNLNLKQRILSLYHH